MCNLVTEFASCCYWRGWRPPARRILEFHSMSGEGLQEVKQYFQNMYGNVKRCMFKIMILRTKTLN
jgi:hypothetical protein